MSLSDFNGKSEVEKRNNKVRRMRWSIWCIVVVVGVTVAVVSPGYLLLVLAIASLILGSHLPYSVRGMFMAAPFTRNLSKHKKHDHDT